MRRVFHIGATALAGMMLSAFGVSAAIVSYSHDTPDTGVSAVDTFSLDGFNPAFGTLTGVTITLDTRIWAIVEAANFTTGAIAFSNVTAMSSVDVTGPGPTSTSGDPTIGPFAGPLGAASGTGCPGFINCTPTVFTSDPTVATDSDSVIVPMANWGLYIGVGPIVDVTVEIGDGLVSGSPVRAGVLFGGAVLTGAKTTVTYEYTPSNANQIPEPGTLAMFGTGLLVFAVRRRQRSSKSQ